MTKYGSISDEKDPGTLASAIFDHTKLEELPVENDVNYPQENKRAGVRGRKFLLFLLFDDLEQFRRNCHDVFEDD